MKHNTQFVMKILYPREQFLQILKTYAAKAEEGLYEKSHILLKIFLRWIEKFQKAPQILFNYNNWVELCGVEAKYLSKFYVFKILIVQRSQWIY